MDKQNSYVRYYIPTSPAPTYPLPHRFEPLVDKKALAKRLVREGLKFFVEGLRKRNPIAYIRAALDRPCKYGVYSTPLGGFNPLKSKCARCFACKIEAPEVIKDVIINPEFRALERLGLTADDVDSLLYEAETGKERVSGMGYKGPFVGSGWDSIWLDMSEIVRPTRDGKEGREYISTESSIGRKPQRLGQGVLRLVTIQLPIIFDYQPPEFTNPSIERAIVTAAKTCGTMAVVSAKNFVRLKKEYGAHLVPLIVAEDKIPDAKIIELYCETDESFEFIRKKQNEIRKRSESAIIIVRLRAKKDIEETVSELTEYVDGVHLCANYNGYEFEKTAPRHLSTVLRSVHKRLIEKGVRSELTIIASGGILMAEHVPKAMGCGADAVGIDLAIHVALQSRFEDFGSDYRIKPRSIDVKWAAQRLVNLIAAWHEQHIEALSAQGKRDSRRLTGDEGRLIFFKELERSAFGDIPREKYAGT